MAKDFKFQVLIFSLSVLPWISTPAKCASYNLLANPGFEDSAGSAPIVWSRWDWPGWPDSWTDYKNDSLSLDGYYVNGGGQKGGAGGWYQDVSSSPGDVYILSADARTEDWGSPNGQLKVSFYDPNYDPGAGIFLREDIMPLFGGTIDTSWSRYTLTTDPAPAGTTNARLEVIGRSTGTILFDNVFASLEGAPDVNNDPDFNNDRWVDLTDFAQLASFWQQTSSVYDLDGDEYIDAFDLDILSGKWLTEIDPPYEGLLVEIDQTRTFQEMHGFGASLTESSAWLLYNALTEQERQAVMLDLFDPVLGIGLNYLRQPMGTSDFRVTKDYSYDDIPGDIEDDYELSLFSIDNDRPCIIPALKEAMAINPDIKIMGSPWSPPPWMKTNLQYAGGKLIDDDRIYNTYAEYFVKYVQAYQAEGIIIEAVTPQNEPGLETDYPSLDMSPDEQIRFVRLLGQKFDANSITTKIIIWDFNWHVDWPYPPNFPLAVLDDTIANPYIDGTAFHGYGGNIVSQTTVHNAYPDKNIYFTEWSDGTWNDMGFGGNLIDNAKVIIRTARRWAKNYIKWNLALDENNGPKIGGGCDTCYGVVTINQSTSEVTRRPQYYSLGHFSKFVKPGATRIDSTEFPGVGIENITFVNSDGSLVALVVNPDNAEHNLKVQWNSQSFIYTLPPVSLTTFVWPDTLNATVEVWITNAEQTKLLERQPDISFHTD